MESPLSDLGPLGLLPSCSPQVLHRVGHCRERPPARPGRSRCVHVLCTGHLPRQPRVQSRERCQSLCQRLLPLCGEGTAKHLPAYTCRRAGQGCRQACCSGHPNSLQNTGGGSRGLVSPPAEYSVLGCTWASHTPQDPSDVMFLAQSFFPEKVLGIHVENRLSTSSRSCPLSWPQTSFQGKACLHCARRPGMLAGTAHGRSSG